MSQLVLAGTAGGVATLTLNSPANRNALSTPLLGALREALAAAVADPAVRVVVLDHAPPAFCSGVDLAETRRGGDPLRPFAELLDDVWNSPTPVVARAAGPARAGGLGLLAAADIALCARTATFAFTEVHLGVVPAVISATVLPRLTSRAAARYLLTGEVFDGAQAERIGLVTEAVPAADLDAAVAAVCAALSRGAPAAVAGTKQLLRRRPPPTFADDLAELSASYFHRAD